MKNYRRKFLIVCWWAFYLWVGSTLYSGQGWATEVSMIRGVLRVTYPLSIFYVQYWIKVGKELLREPDAQRYLSEYVPEEMVPLVVLPIFAAAGTFYFLTFTGVGVLLSYIGRFFD